MPSCCPSCGKAIDLIEGSDFVCECTTPSRLKRAWNWLKVCWINWRLPKPKPEPEDWWEDIPLDLIEED